MSAFATPTLTGYGTNPVAAMSEMVSLGPIGHMHIPTSIVPTSSYDTGGSAVTLPVGTQGWTLNSIRIDNWNNGTHMYVWTGTTTSPLIKCLTALPNTEVAAATDLHTDAALKVTFIYTK